MAELPPQVILPEDHKFARRQTISLHEIIDEPMIMLDLPHSRDYFLSLFHAVNLEPKMVHRTRSYDRVRGLVGRHRGYGMLNAIPRMPYTLDGTRVVAVAIKEELPRTPVAGLQLRRAQPRRAVAAFHAFARDYFAGAWPEIVDAPSRRRRQ